MRLVSYFEFQDMLRRLDLQGEKSILHSHSVAARGGRPQFSDSWCAGAALRIACRSSQFWKLLDHHAQLTTVATGFGFTEGPVWDPSGFLYVSDEEINKIFRVYLADGGRRKSSLLATPTEYL